jgi:hypothetical protein
MMGILRRRAALDPLRVNSEEPAAAQPRDQHPDGEVWSLSDEILTDDAKKLGLLGKFALGRLAKPNPGRTTFRDRQVGNSIDND